jgi:predicted dehydrogenase
VRILLLTVLAAQMVFAQKPARLIVFDPGHFHATLLQKEMYPEIDQRVSVYAPLGPELLEYLNRVSLFNLRPANPTRWELDVHTSDHPFEQMLRDKPGNVVVFSGKNRGKIDRIAASIDAGLNVLADKPWIITSDEMPKLERALDLAEKKHVAAYDIMTERYEAVSQVQRVLVNTPDVFGKQVAGDAANPGVTARSVHHIMKVVAGVPLRRPVWFFDVDDYGEGLADVGTHPVDLIQWTMFPDQMLDYRKDVRMISGRHERLRISDKQFADVTGVAKFPASLPNHVHDGALDLYCNNYIEYLLRGVHVKLDVLWKWEAPAGTGDVYEASFRGTLASIQLRQGAAEKYAMELYVVPVEPARAQVFAALDHAIAGLQQRWPGISASRTATEAHIVIPEKFNVGHEEHFAQVANHFFEYVKSPASMPAWEKSYMLAKYYVTTKGVELARK